MRPIIIVTIGAYNNVIGNNGKLPWGRLPIYLKRFKEITTGGAVVMGYNTYVSIGKPLPGRRNIVLTNHPEKLNRFNGEIGITGNICDVLEIAKRKRVFIIGGQNVYQQFIDCNEVNMMYITRIHARFHGDTFFPEFPTNKWQIIRNEQHKTSAENKYPLSFEIWTRG